jgi:hypothetical protein
MLFEIETAAFSNWFRVPECPRKHGLAVNANTATASSIASFQTGNSSKRLYFTEALSSAQDFALESIIMRARRILV